LSHEKVGPSSGERNTADPKKKIKKEENIAGEAFPQKGKEKRDMSKENFINYD